MMIKGWLKGMLTPAKQDSEMWQGWVDTIQSMLGSEVEPIIERIDARKSLFSMKGEDLNTRVNELGQFFSIRSKNEASKPILLAQRIDEIHFKGTERPLTATFWREFENLPAHWEPLYAPINQKTAPYGSYLIPKDSISFAKQQYGNFYMTSRGKIALSINALYQQYGANKQADLLKRIQAQFDEVIAPLLPLDIVCDGFLLYLDYHLFEYAPDLLLVRDNNQDQMPFAIGTVLNKPDPITGDHPYGIWGETGFIVGQQVGKPYTQSSIPSVPLNQAIRAQDYEIKRFDSVPLDTWPLDSNTRPAIYVYSNPNTTNPYAGSKPDNRLVVTSTGVTIDTMGAAYIRVIYTIPGDYEDYATNGVDKLPIAMTAARAAQIFEVIYSMT